MFAVKNYQQGTQRLLAACDEVLLDTVHEEGKFKLQVPSGFYDGLRVDEKTLTEYLRMCTMANLVGPKTVDIAVNAGFVERENVLVIGGIPHAQMMVLGP